MTLKSRLAKLEQRLKPRRPLLQCIALHDHETAGWCFHNASGDLVRVMTLPGETEDETATRAASIALAAMPGKGLALYQIVEDGRDFFQVKDDYLDSLCSDWREIIDCRSPAEQMAKPL